MCLYPSEFGRQLCFQTRCKREFYTQGFAGIEYLQNDSVRGIKCTNACEISEKTAGVWKAHPSPVFLNGKFKVCHTLKT